MFVQEQTTKAAGRRIQGDAPEKLRSWRGERNQTDAAVELGISQAMYSAIETGVKYPGADIQVVVQRVAGVPLEAWGPNPRRLKAPPPTG